MWRTAINIYNQRIYLGWSGSIDLEHESVFFIKILGSILFGVNLGELI